MKILSLSLQTGLLPERQGLLLVLLLVLAGVVMVVVAVVVVGVVMVVGMVAENMKSELVEPGLGWQRPPYNLRAQIGDSPVVLK